LNPTIRIFRALAVLAGHFLAAVVATKLFEEELSHVFPGGTLREVLRREYLLSAIFAFVLGYFVYYKWRSAPAKFVWIVGALLFTDRALSAWHARYSFATGEPRFVTVCYEMFGPAYQPNSTEYAITLVRTTLYSIGAWACWYGEKYGWSAVLHYVKVCLHALRGGGSGEI
jgi:hypothetical protein